MEIWLTRGMFGEKFEKVADAETGEEAMKALHEWKSGQVGKKKYKIERYDRFIFGEEGSDEVAVDFGDWSYFALVTGEGSKAGVSGALRFK